MLLSLLSVQARLTSPSSTTSGRTPAPSGTPGTPLRSTSMAPRPTLVFASALAGAEARANGWYQANRSFNPLIFFTFLRRQSGTIANQYCLYAILPSNSLSPIACGELLLAFFWTPLIIGRPMSVCSRSGRQHDSGGPTIILAGVWIW